MNMPPPRTQTDWVLIGLLFAVGLFASGQFAKIALTLEPLGTAFPEAGRSLPFLVSLVGLTGILFGATAGLLAGRWGLRRVLISAMVGGGVLSLVEALMPPLPVFVVLRLLEGASHLSIVVCAPTLMVAAAALRDRPVAMGLWGTFFGVGFALLALVAPALLDLGGPSLVFALHGAGLLLLAFLLWPRLPDIPQTSPRVGFVAQHLAIYRDPRVIAPGLGFLWYALQFLALLTFLPAHLPPGAAVVLPLASLLGSFGAGILARFWPAHRIAVGGFVASALALALLLFLPEALRLPMALLAFALIGLIPGAIFAAIPELNADSADQAKAQGALAQMGNVGTTFGPPIFALVLWAGFPGLIGLAVATGLAGAAILGLILLRIR
jgi:predicted MFS family arabinose efflux permease